MPQANILKIISSTLRQVWNIVSLPFLNWYLAVREVFSMAGKYPRSVSLNLLQASICRNHLPTVVSSTKSAYSAWYEHVEQARNNLAACSSAGTILLQSPATSCPLIGQSSSPPAFLASDWTTRVVPLSPITWPGCGKKSFPLVLEAWLLQGSTRR